jgi:hypothetical protein
MATASNTSFDLGILMCFTPSQRGNNEKYDIGAIVPSCTIWRFHGLDYQPRRSWMALGLMPQSSA